MEATRTINEQIASARNLEKNGQLSGAAVIYQRIFDKDPNNQQVMSRLLVIYRKLKGYPKELAVLNKAIEHYQQTRKTAQDKWIQSNPAAARAGRSILKQLEKSGDTAMVPGATPTVERWVKRKEFVTARITGKKRKKRPKPEKSKTTASVHITKPGKQPKKKEVDKRQQARESAAMARKTAAQERRELAAKSALHPSLFVIILRYLVALEKIDAVMKQHMAFLDKHYANKDFLVSGRQVPRTGGIIIARAKDRNTVEKIVQQDPFVKRRLASADIIEFTASQHGKDLQAWIK